MSTFALSKIACEEPDHIHNQECHYKVAWSINPHMVPGSTRLSAAHAQHALLRSTLVDSGAHVIDMPFVHGGFDSVFIKDNAFLFKSGETFFALMTRPRFDERAREQRDRMRRFSELGFITRPISVKSHVEGGDLVAPGHGRGIFVGHGFRTEESAALDLSLASGMPTCALELVDEGLYHLDTALAVFKDGTAIACKDAFTGEAWRKLRRSPWIERMIVVSREEAMSFACNLVQVGQRIIVGSRVPRLMDRLCRFGFEATYVPLSEFQRAGGSAACLVAEIKNYARSTTIPMAAIRSMPAYA